jgi:hypothetical protein
MPDSYVAPPAVKTEYFTQPRIHYAETFVFGTPVGPAPGFVWIPGAPGPLAYVNQEIYKVSRPTLIDYIAITEETLSCNTNCPMPLAGPPVAMTGVLPGTNGSFLNGLRVNWWVTDRPRAALRLRSPYEYDNYADRIGVDAAVAGLGWIDPSFTWKFRRPWTYKPGNSVVVAWTYTTGEWSAPVLPAPDGPMPPAFPPLRLILSGEGVRTRHRRIFEFEMPASAAPAAPIGLGPQIWDTASNGTFSDHEFIAQLNDEPYEIDTLAFQYVNRNPITAEALVFPPLDVRMLNMMRLQIRPSQSEPFSDDPVPLLLYGVDIGLPGRIAWYQPTGGPILLQPGQAIGWEIQSFLPPHDTAPLPIVAWPPPAPFGAILQTVSRFQAALIGRTAPREVAL